MNKPNWKKIRDNSHKQYRIMDSDKFMPIYPREVREAVIEAEYYYKLLLQNRALLKSVQGFVKNHPTLAPRLEKMISTLDDVVITDS